MRLAGVFDVVLMGLRGSGKSTVGRLVADRLGRAFVDVDALVLEGLGFGTVGGAWAVLGEAAFRAEEGRCVEWLLGDGGDGGDAGDREGDGRGPRVVGGRVIALGGGTPTVDRARAALARARGDGRARCVYLRATAEALAGRIGREDANRPRLGGASDVLDEMRAMLAARESIYLGLADVVVDAEASAEEVAGAIVEGLER